MNRLFGWSGWPRLAAIATALTAVAALWFSAQSLGSTQKQYALSEQGQVTDRFTKAVEQLGSDKLDIRLGGIYSLERLTRDSPADRSVIFEVLSAYIRTHAGPADKCNALSVPLADVQAALAVIGRRDRAAPQFERIDLQTTCLANVILTRAYLDGVLLNASYLVGAWLPSASLVDAGLLMANLNAAKFTDANLTGADLSIANLYYSSLDQTNLTGAKLYAADLSDANLIGATLARTDLGNIYYNATTRWPEGFTPPPSRPRKDQT
ncbi:pentapeptide repeat-containing protein [Mycobacterium sp. 050128]|uniref:pentapeptide repeat-containing protein n=1 Tax=Mycobacterium sp. 050128 TaxID=3096112 RepID=UPI002ED9255B